MYWLHLNNNNLVTSKEINEKRPESKKIVMVTKEIYDTVDIGWHLIGQGVWEPPASSNPIEPEHLDVKESRLKELRAKLRDSDRLVIEILEAQLMNILPMAQNVEKIYDQRKQWREEIEKLSE